MTDVKCFTLKPVLWTLAVAIAGCISDVASPQKVKRVEQIFVENRADFIELTETSVQKLEQSGNTQLRLPDTALYDLAWAARGLDNEAIIVDFVVDEFYLPLVYISTDNPEDAHDTCASGGRSITQLEPHWYICRRDWN